MAAPSVTEFASYESWMEASIAWKSEVCKDLYWDRRKGPCIRSDAYVYLIWHARTGYFKIGYSMYPKARERTLQAEDPGLELLATLKGTKQDERRLHKHYAEYRKRGEWFALPTNIAINLKEWMHADGTIDDIVNDEWSHVTVAPYTGLEVQIKGE
jgi:hypothetical protein